MVGISVINEDITTLNVDAIVNAANESLLGGGGVDGAIHRVAGPELLAECRTLGGCKTGEAKITKGYNLPAKYIIHTVGPRYSGRESDAVNLRNCYVNSIKLAVEHNIKSIAFPSISTGAFGYPKDEAAHIAIDAVIDMLAEYDDLEVTFCCFGNAIVKRYNEILAEKGYDT